MISLITQINDVKRRSYYYYVKAINLDTKSLKNGAWKLYTLIKLFKHNLILYFLTGEKEQLYLKLPNNMKETLLQVLTDQVAVRNFTSKKLIEEWKEVSTTTITIKFL